MPATDEIVEMDISSEALAYWYLRLNGFLTITNFVVHTESRYQGTEVDILGVRFPYRAELHKSSLRHSMQDAPQFADHIARPYIVIAEVKRKRCDLNGPWTEPGKENMHRVLRAIGALPLEDIDEAAASLYAHGVFKSPWYFITLLCLGATPNAQIDQDYPNVPQITWRQVLSFIHRRFTMYSTEKASHPQWDEHGKRLWDCALSHKNARENFCRAVTVTDE